MKRLAPLPDEARIPRGRAQEVAARTLREPPQAPALRRAQKAEAQTPWEPPQAPALRRSAWSR